MTEKIEPGESIRKLAVFWSAVDFGGALDYSFF
jgi:hypothetical protein